MSPVIRGLIHSCRSYKLMNYLCRKLGVKVGDNVRIRSGAEFNLPNVEIGNNTFINYRRQFNTGWDGNAKITISENVYIAMDVSFICVSHEIGTSECRAGAGIYEDIFVGPGAWIGARSTILPGVNIGEGVVIGAGSVVVKDCEPNCLYAGAPAKKIKELP